MWQRRNVLSARALNFKTETQDYGRRGGIKREGERLCGERERNDLISIWGPWEGRRSVGRSRRVITATATKHGAFVKRTRCSFPARAQYHTLTKEKEKTRPVSILPPPLSFLFFPLWVNCHKLSCFFFIDLILFVLFLFPMKKLFFYFFFQPKK
jgi:hypothetical protein